VQERDRAGAHGVGDDRAQLGAHAVELSEQRHRTSEQAAAAGDPCRRDESETPNPLGFGSGELCCDQPAERVADEIDRPEVGCSEESAQPRSELTGSQATEAGQLHEMEPKLRREALDEWRPPSPRAGQTVHDDDVRARSGHAIARRGPVEPELLQLHARILHPDTAVISHLG